MRRRGEGPSFLNGGDDKESKIERFASGPKLYKKYVRLPDIFHSESNKWNNKEKGNSSSFTDPNKIG